MRVLVIILSFSIITSGLPVRADIIRESPVVDPEDYQIIEGQLLSSGFDTQEADIIIGSMSRDDIDFFCDNPEASRVGGRMSLEEWIGASVMIVAISYVVVRKLIQKERIFPISLSKE